MDIFLTSISSIIPIIVIIVLGYALQVRGWFTDNFGPTLSHLIMKRGAASVHFCVGP